MRLIDADALKDHKFTTQAANGVEIYSIEVVLVASIDNAPTVVKIDTNDIEYKTYCKGLEDGKNIKRLSGKWNYIQAGMCVCPFCGASPHKVYKNFCPKCGADMRGADNE